MVFLRGSQLPFVFWIAQIFLWKRRVNFYVCKVAVRFLSMLWTSANPMMPEIVKTQYWCALLWASSQNRSCEKGFCLDNKTWNFFPGFFGFTMQDYECFIYVASWCAGLTNLESLNLDSCKVGDEGVEHLSGAPFFPLLMNSHAWISETVIYARLGYLGHLFIHLLLLLVSAWEMGTCVCCSRFLNNLACQFWRSGKSSHTGSFWYRHWQQWTPFSYW
jgi:hypothetical protein